MYIYIYIYVVVLQGTISNPTQKQNMNGSTQGERGRNSQVPYLTLSMAWISGFIMLPWMVQQPFPLAFRSHFCPFSKRILFSPADQFCQQEEGLSSKESHLGLARVRHLQLATLWLKFSDGCLWGRGLTVGRKLLALKSITGILL